jgi:hypothetical protein
LCLQILPFVMLVLEYGYRRRQIQRIIAESIQGFRSVLYVKEMPPAVHAFIGS